MIKFFIFIFIFIPFSISANSISEKEKIKAEQMLYNSLLKNCPSITAASFPNNPPFGWTEKKISNGKTINYSAGVGIEILNKIANKLNVKVHNVAYPSYEEAFKALMRNEIDLLTGFYFNPLMLTSSVQVITPSYFLNPVTVFYRSDNPFDIKSLNELEELKIGFRKDEGLYAQLITNLPKNIETSHFSSSEEAFEALLTGEVDLLLGSLYGLETEKNRLKLGSKIEHGSYILENYGFFFTFSTVSKCRKWSHFISKKLQDLDKTNEVLNLITELDEVYRKKYINEPSLLSQLGFSEENETIEELPFEVINIPLDKNSSNEEFSSKEDIKP